MSNDSSNSGDLPRTEGASPADDEPFIIMDDETAIDSQAEPNGREALDDELDGLRIRQLVHLKRSNYRSQTYAIIGMVVCVVAATKLVLLARAGYLTGQWLPVIGYGIVAAICAVGAVVFAIHADRLRDELKTPPKILDREPDFESLSDGSQHVTNLETMTEKPGER
ncbi:MAG: hypothetical protein JO353_07910 [Phycisphaerae bacterium]|nr:hypothetical protein [Phycisphaerae bacterium]